MSKMSTNVTKHSELSETLPYNAKYAEVLRSKPKGHLSKRWLTSTNLVLPQAPQTSEFSFKEFCERMTSHGLIDFYLAQSLIAKLFWLIVVICSLILTGYYIYDEISEYVQCPILTTISFKPQLALPFPVVYICPFQFAYWDYIEKCGNASEFSARSAVLKSHNNFAKILGGQSNHWHEVATQTQHLLSSSPMQSMFSGDSGPDIPKVEPDCPEIDPDETFQDYIIRQAITIPMFLRECSFISKEMNCSKIATRVLDKEFGVCYLVDLSKQGNYSKQNTANLGLSLLIDLQLEQAMLDTEKQPGALVEGALVRVLDENDPAAYGGHLMQPGTYSKMSLSATKIELISYIESLTPQQCTVNDKYQFSVLQNVSYTQDSCRMDCALEVMTRKCECTLPVDRSYLNPNAINFTDFDQVCNASTFESCVLPGFESSEKYISCINLCFRACSSLEVNVETSQATFPSEEARMKAHHSQTDNISQIKPKHNPDIIELSEEFNKTTADNGIPPVPIKRKVLPTFQGKLGPVDVNNINRWSRNLIVLDIAYGNLEYTIYEQRPSRTYTSLVANVGGQAGLWTGASIFTLLQLFIFSIYFVCRKKPRIAS